MKRQIIGLLAAGLLAGPLAANAVAVDTSAVVSFSGGNTYPVFSSDETIGWMFASSNSIVVTALGWNVTTAVGSNSSHQVGIWDSAGTLLGSVIVDAGSATDGIWRFTGISPIALSAGEYYIGGRDTAVDGDSYLSSVSDLTLASGLTFVGSAVSGSGGGFAFPSAVNKVTVNGRFGPNFQFRDGDAVPEPATLALLGLGFAGAGFGAPRRRRPR